MAAKDADFPAGLDRIASSSTFAELEDAAMASIRSYGFQCAYLLIPVTADPRFGRVLTNLGFSDEWERAYREVDHLVDPLPALAINRSSAFRWSDATQLGALSAEATDFLDRMKLAGLEEGVAIPCFGPHARSGFIGIAKPLDEVVITDKLLRRVQLAGQVAFQAYCEIEPSHEELVPALSQRELEVIRWIGEGKSNAVIAAILDISKSSVDIYVKRIFAKLRVHDRTTASVRALSLGLIAPASPTHAADVEGVEQFDPQTIPEDAD